jgi:myo-inositol-1(or 4)-monophosphatase
MALGVTYDPMPEELFTAQAGQGAFLNGNPMAVSTRQELGGCVLGFDLGYVDEKAGLALDMMRGLWPGFQSMRLMGSSALGLAYAAAGRVDLYFHHALAPWDVAAGLLLAREAGGEVVDRQGRRALLHTPSVIAASPHLIGRFLKATDGMPWRQG